MDERVLSSGHVRLRRSSTRAVLTLDRPDRLNALDDAMFDDLLTALADLARDEQLRVVSITGAGRAFCVGGDLRRRAEGAALPDVETSVAELRRKAEVGVLLTTMPAVTVAAVNGACAGAGLAIAAWCDLRIACSSAIFATAYLNAGLSGDLGGLRALTRLVGRSTATRWFVMPEKVGAEEALRAGLVSQVVEPEEFDSTIDAVTARLARSAPLALRAIKANLADLDEPDLSRYLDREARRHAEVRLTEDASEAAAAFVEKRPPVFRGC